MMYATLRWQTCRLAPGLTLSSSFMFIASRASREASAMTQMLLHSTQAPTGPATLGARQRDLRQLVNAMAYAIVTIDDTGRISMINKQTEALFGYSAKELLSQPVETLLPERFQERHQSLVARYLDHPRTRPMESGLELLGKRKDGSEIPLEISLGPLELDGRLQVVAAIRDISERREAERAQEEFIESAAHALRTPLAALRGYVDTLVVQTSRGKGAPLADWQDEAIQEIGQAAERLEALSTMLMDVTRIRSGHLSLRLEAHDLVTLVRRVAAQMRRGGDHHIFTIRTPVEPVIAPIDARRIEQTLRHLLDNAMKYSPEGGIIEVILRSRRQRGEAIVEVRDHGVGIAPSQRARLFSRFGGYANDAGAPGTGLGLYLSQYFVERHGGQIGARSRQDKSATFWFTLPLERDAADDDSRGHNGHQDQPTPEPYVG
jgi:protein-histidine pros-kinase